MAAKPIPLFRREAVDAQRARGVQGEALTLDPRANAWGFALLCVGLAFFGFFVSVGRINEYASGPSFIELDGGQHSEQEQKVHDEQRTEWLRS